MTEEMHYVNYRVEEHAAIIEFYHPKANSFPSSQLKTLQKILSDLGKKDEIKVILIQSKGDAIFSAGASFEELTEINNIETAKKFFQGFANVILEIKSCPKIIVAAVEGKAVGGGVGLLAACDYILAYKNADVKLSELSIGFGPFVIEPAIRRKIGLAAMTELTLNPTEWKDVNWSFQKGLFSKIFTEKESFEEGKKTFLRDISKYSLEAMQNIKKVLWEGTEKWNEILPKRAEISGKLLLNDSTQTLLEQIKNNS